MKRVKNSFEEFCTSFTVGHEVQERWLTIQGRRGAYPDTHTHQKNTLRLCRIYFVPSLRDYAMNHVPGLWSLATPVGKTCCSGRTRPPPCTNTTLPVDNRIVNTSPSGWILCKCTSLKIIISSAAVRIPVLMVAWCCRCFRSELAKSFSV